MTSSQPRTQCITSLSSRLETITRGLAVGDALDAEVKLGEIDQTVHEQIENLAAELADVSEAYGLQDVAIHAQRLDALVRKGHPGASEVQACLDLMKEAIRQAVDPEEPAPQAPQDGAEEDAYRHP